MTSQSVVIAIDGPSGAGKSTAARRLAARLGFQFLDTGAMYRAVAWLVLRKGISPADESAVAELLRGLRLRFSDDGTRIFVRRAEEIPEDVTEAIRKPEVTKAVSAVSALACVRQKLTHEQRAFAEKRRVVAEGRDTATVVFPDADRKFFVTASLEARARRRQMERPELAAVSLEEIAREISERDAKDSGREIAPLRPAPGAVRIDTTQLEIEAVVDVLARHCAGLAAPSV
jgi:CMP/dCMP kinase